MSDLATWRVMLANAVADDGPVIAVAPSESVLDVEFDSGYGETEGAPMLAWTATHVYFPVCYDGSEWVDSAPRNPTVDGQEHVGG